MMMKLELLRGCSNAESKLIGSERGRQGLTYKLMHLLQLP